MVSPHLGRWLVSTALPAALALTASPTPRAHVVKIQTCNGYYLTAVNGGGVGGSNHGSGSAAMHTDANSPAPGP